MDMSLIHATAERMDVGYVREYEKFDAQLKRGGSLSENSYQLTMHRAFWEASPIRRGDYLYIDRSEWGGPVDLVRHNTYSGIITLSGPLWRGLLLEQVVEPPEGQTHLVIDQEEANRAVGIVLGDAYAGLFTVPEVSTGAFVSGSFRYRKALESLETMLRAADMRLKAVYDARESRVRLYAEKAVDYSDTLEMSQDQGVQLTTQLGKLECYNRVIALGRGEMEERTIISVYRLPDGTIWTERPPDWDVARERCITLEYSNAEDEQELIDAAIARLQEYGALESLDVNIVDTGLPLEIGDRIAARDRVTGLEATVSVSGMLLTMDRSGAKIQMKVD